jgi:hypothetical protein
MSVAQDSASRKYCPETAAQWTELLTGLSINNPSSWWLCQEPSGNLVDSGSGGRTVTVNGSPAYQASAPGWIRKGIKPTDNSATMYGSCTIPDVNTTSSMLLQMFSLNTPATAQRGLNMIGLTTAERASVQAGNKLRGSSHVSNADGSQQHTGTLVVITKFDRAHSALGVYTQHEQIKPTFNAPGASTTMYMFGDGIAASDATLVYSALWTGADAEISDAKIQDLLDAIDGAELTIEKMEAGSFAHKWVVEIEGCPYLPSDAPAAAVLNAYPGRDWTQVLGGLFVEVRNDQRIKPFAPFADGGTCQLRVVDTDHTDVFGKYLWRRAGGFETIISSTVDRDDTTINVKSTSAFASSGEIYIGTECIGYAGKTATSFTGCTRGKYSPFGTALTGAGGIRFGNHHRVGTDANHVQMNPVVSSIPRVWLGKRIAVRLHTWDAVNQTINARAEAQLVFAGRITDIADDANTAAAIIECDHVLSELQEVPIFREQFIAEAAPGLSLITDRVFYFTDVVHGSAGLLANNLTVVAGAPANTNQIQAGTYSLQEMCEALNRWLGGEKAAGRINGHYSWSIGANTDGMRARCHWRIQNATANLTCGWNLSLPSDVASFLGLSDAEPDLYGGTTNFFPEKSRTNIDNIVSGKASPFTTLIFRPWAARIGQDFVESPYIDTDNIRGAFIGQRDRMPASIKASCDSSAQWGIFLLDEKLLVVARYDSSAKRLNNCWIAPFQMPTAEDSSAVGYFGRRADDNDAGPVTIRQILILEGSLFTLTMELMYSTGVSGYNHATYDTLGVGLGVGLPGEVLGEEFERSVSNLPNSDAPLVLLIDEPTTIQELIGSDLMFRWAFLRWKDQNLEACTWKTPLNELAIATLSESNKMLPAENDSETHRVSSQESNEFQYATVKIDFNRNFSLGRNGDYQKSVKFEDQTAVDDSGGGARTATLKLRNTFTQYTNTGSSVEAGLPEFMVHMPSISRSSRKIARTLSATLFESIAPGDIVTMTDKFARDPRTGARGVNSRAAFVTRVAYDLGGPDSDPEGHVRPMDGEIEINFLDTQRGQKFAPAADIDDTQNAGGFSAGYNSGTSTIRCYKNHYSHVLVIKFRRGTFYLSEAADASNFHAGDKILIVERDPASTASPTFWERTIQSVSGNDIVLTSGLSSPAWDSAKRYRVVPQKYSQVVSTQRDFVYQADDADNWVEDVEIPWHYSATEEAYDYNAYDNTTPGEFVPDMCYGDGRPYDVGHEQAIARTINAFIDRKSAHQSPYLHNSALALYDEVTASWFTMAFGPIFLGTEHLSSAVTRTLTVAPFYRSQAGGTAKIRITIMRSQPVAAAVGFLPGEQYRDSVFNDHYSQSAVYMTTSTTWQTGADATLTLDTKDIFFGFVWVLLEGQGDVECRGLGKCIEGPRVTS